MPYCVYCGNELSSEAAACPHCGCAVDRPNSPPPPPPYQPCQPYAPPPADPDEPNTGLNIIAFLIPAIGAIVYLLKYQQYPIQAKSLGKWALIGFALRTAASVLLFIFFFTLSFLGRMRW